MRVVNEAGDMLGVMPPGEALSMAADQGLDLVEIAPKANPPTCKIMDYGKWKFKLSKKEKLSRKNQIKIIVKEVQLRPRTDTHDLEIKMRKAKEFLLNGCKVKIHLRYSGREMAHKELGLKMLEQVKEVLLPFSVLETDTPQVERRSVFLFFAPDPVKVRELQKKKKQSASAGAVAKGKPATSPAPATSSAGPPGGEKPAQSMESAEKLVESAKPAEEPASAEESAQPAEESASAESANKSAESVEESASAVKSAKPANRQ